MNKFETKKEILDWLGCYYGLNRTHRDIVIEKYDKINGITHFGLKLGSSWLGFSIFDKNNFKDYFRVNSELTYIYNVL